MIITPENSSLSLVIEDLAPSNLFNPEQVVLIKEKIAAKNCNPFIAYQVYSLLEKK